MKEKKEFVTCDELVKAANKIAEARNTVSSIAKNFYCVTKTNTQEVEEFEKKAHELEKFVEMLIGVAVVVNSRTI